MALFLSLSFWSDTEKWEMVLRALQSRMKRETIFQVLQSRMGREKVLCAFGSPNSSVQNRRENDSALEIWDWNHKFHSALKIQNWNHSALRIRDWNHLASGIRNWKRNFASET
ncbi:hypothetical protein C1645_821496 [Glomus cerebriforme]|uniref:Uncharacterized protein n=1 Tax=Glomus cerebriforme TaxID=658196 RepID=A0A397T4L6_9GLOM|nr:hypothetical protein C1645_821496 [Glomus cerebriforme]